MLQCILDRNYCETSRFRHFSFFMIFEIAGKSGLTTNFGEMLNLARPKMRWALQQPALSLVANLICKIVSLVQPRCVLLGDIGRAERGISSRMAVTAAKFPQGIQKQS